MNDSTNSGGGVLAGRRATIEETTKKDDVSRQSPSVPRGTTGSPRSPQPEGSKR